MERIYNPLLITILFLAAGFCEAAEEKQNNTLNIASQKQLLIDDLFFDQSENIRLKLHPAKKSGKPSIVRDQPWESATLNWFSFLEDNGKYRMWYECYDVDGWPTTNDTAFCYAESEDGIHWTKPELGLVEYQGNKKNNILFRQIGPKGAQSRVHGSCVFIDPSAPPESRYKAISQGMFPAPPNYRIAGMYSADGLRWTRYPKPIVDLFADSQYSAFWDNDKKQYAIFGRAFHRSGRALGQSTGKDFSQMPKLTLTLGPSENDPPKSDLYNSAAMKYPHAENVYFMFPSLFQHDPQTLDIRFAVSRDGVKWTYPEQNKPFIPLGKKGEFDSGSLYMGQGIIRKGSELSLYYGGSRLNHAEGGLENLIKPNGSRSYSRVTVPLDRFVSAEAEKKAGYFVTPPLTFTGNILSLNAEIHEGGSIRLALLDESGKELENRAVKDCLPVGKHAGEKQVYWKRDGDVSAYEGQKVRLRFEMQNASLFTFQFKEGYPYLVK